MVATRDTKDRLSAVDLLTGKFWIDPKTIEPGQWIELIYSAVELLPIKYLRGFSQIVPILEGGSLNVRRSGQWSHIFDGQETSTSIRLKRHGVFLCCTDIESFFPASWEAAYEMSDQDFSKDLPSILTDVLLLSRDGDFWLIKTTWIPRVAWDENATHSRPSMFVYEADVEHITVQKLACDELGTFLSQKDLRFRMTVLSRLWQAIHLTMSELRGQFEQAIQVELKLKSILNLMNVRI